MLLTGGFTLYVVEWRNALGRTAVRCVRAKSPQEAARVVPEYAQDSVVVEEYVSRFSEASFRMAGRSI